MINWTIVLPALFDLARAIVERFERRPSEKRQAVLRLIARKFPDIPDHMRNLALEIGVFAVKRGVSPEDLSQAIQDGMRVVWEAIPERLPRAGGEESAS